jgi:hypothetical protein
MCGGLLFFALLAFLPAALPGQEEVGSWYMISEGELRSIERYKEQSEAERRNWLLQAQTLKTKAANSAARSANLERESASLNRQLSAAREAQRKSDQLYERSEAERLTLLSSKNGEIAALKEERETERLRAEKYKGQAWARLIIIIALGLGIGGVIVIRVLRIIPV